jgi:hypothetical protein
MLQNSLRVLKLEPYISTGRSETCMQKVRSNDHSVMQVVEDLRTGASRSSNSRLEVCERFTSSVLHKKIMHLACYHAACRHSGVYERLGSGVHSSSTSSMTNGVRLNREVTSSGSSVTSPGEGVNKRIGTDVVHGLEGVPYIGG